MDIKKNLPFVNRIDELLTFDDVIHSASPDAASVLIYTGIGGQGKTSLNRRLRERILSGEANLEKVKQASVEFGETSSPPNADRMLIRLRNELYKAGVRFPVFDYAVMLHWAANYDDEAPPDLENSFIREMGLGEIADDAVEDLANSGFEKATKEVIQGAMNEIPGFQFIFSKGRKYIFDKVRLNILKKRRKYLLELFEEDGSTIRPRHEIAEAYPHMFAHDLAEHLSENPNNRFVIFIDNYDRLGENPLTRGRYTSDTFDKCFQMLLAKCPGLVTCFFAADVPPWMPDFCSEQKIALKAYDLGGLSQTHARNVLKISGIDNDPCMDAIVETARESEAEDAPCYPELLEILVSHWNGLKNENQPPKPSDFQVEEVSLAGKLRAVVERVVGRYGKELHELVTVLSCVNLFNARIVDETADYLRLPRRPLMSLLMAELSFVSQSDGWMSIHRPVREAILAVKKEHETAMNLRLMYDTFLNQLPDTDATSTPPDPGLLPCYGELIRLRYRLQPQGFVEWLEDFAEPLEAAKQVQFLNTQWTNALDWVRADDDVDPLDISTCLNEIASCRRDIGNAVEATKLFADAVRFCKQSHGADHRREIIAYNNLGHALAQVGKTAEAMVCFRSAEKLLPDDGFKLVPERLETLNHLCVAHLDMEENDRALEYSELARDILAYDAPDRRQSALWQNSRGTIELRNGNFDTALEHFRKAEAIWQADRLRNRENLADLSENIALCLEEEQRFDEAMTYYRKSAALLEEVYPFPHPKQANCLYQTAICLNGQNHFELALQHIDEAIGLCEELPEPLREDLEDYRHSRQVVLDKINKSA